MKKIILSLMIIMSTLSIIGCRAQKSTINVSEMKVDISVYHLLPNRLLENSKKQLTTSNGNQKSYQSDVYAKLLHIYQYIDELFIVFNNILDYAIDSHDIISGEVYNYNQYEYFAEKDKTSTSLSIDDTDSDRTLHVTFKNFKDGNKEYSGSHQVKYDLFTFDFLNQKQLTIYFNQDNEQKKSYATISKEDTLVKTHVIYDEGKTSYELYSISSDELTSVYYFSNKKEDVYLNQYFEVIDNGGDILYQSFSMDNGVYQASGWLLNALNIQNVDKISANEFLANNTEFINIPNEANLYEIRMYPDKSVYLLGHLNYKQALLPIIQPRTPFETSYYTMVSNITSETISYYHLINQ